MDEVKQIISRVVDSDDTAGQLRLLNDLRVILGRVSSLEAEAHGNLIRAREAALEALYSNERYQKANAPTKEKMLEFRCVNEEIELREAKIALKLVSLAIESTRTIISARKSELEHHM